MEKDGMLVTIFKKIFGTKNDRELRQMRKVVDRISANEDQLKSLNPQVLRAQTDLLRQRLVEGETLDQICQMLSLWSEKPHSEPWGCAISMCK